MNLSSNHGSCGKPHLCPCLRQGESSFTHNWSRDLPWVPDGEAAQLLCFDEETIIGGGTNSFGSAWDVLPNVPTDGTYNGYGLGPENLSPTGFEDLHNISELEKYKY
jgi:hypothetical protein